MKTAIISISGGTSADIVAAVQDKRIRVINVTVLTNTAGTIKFCSGNTPNDITGAMPVAANGGFSASSSLRTASGEFAPLFETASGEKLSIVSSVSANVGGFLTYVLV